MSDSRPPRAPHPPLPSRRAVRLAALLWVVVGIVLWNALFDHAIVVAGREYLFRQAQALRHNGPAVTIAEVMRPAAVHGAIVASLWSLLVTAVGLVAVRVAATRGGGGRLRAAGTQDSAGSTLQAVSQHGASDPPGSEAGSTDLSS